LSKANETLSATIAHQDAEREQLFDRVAALQENLFRDQDLISGLRGRISQVAGVQAASFTSTEAITSKRRRPSAMPADAIAPYLKHHPILLQSILINLFRNNISASKQMHYFKTETYFEMALLIIPVCPTSRMSTPYQHMQ
jgi:C4-dicarboxylate-specific signal transduction histidine kinase